MGVGVRPFCPARVHVKQILIVESSLLAFFQFTRYLNPLTMRAGADLAVVVNSLIVTPVFSSKVNQSQFLSLESL